jgi:hypothetical protein
MPIHGISKLRFDEQFTATPGPDNAIRIGANVAAPKLVATSKQLRSAIEKFEGDMEAIRNDKNLSDVGKQEQRAARVSAFHLEAQQIRTDAQAHAEALAAEADAIRAKTRNRFAPADPGEKFEAVEYRNILRNMPFEQRQGVIMRALAERDPAMLKALSTMPAWDTTIAASEPVRRLIADSIHNAELDALEPLERVAIENAAGLMEVSARKLQAFDTEARRIMEGR